MKIEIELAAGRIAGSVDNEHGLNIFKGIPFAAPPVAERRWRRAEPAAPWDGSRDCTEFAAAPPQQVNEVMSMFAATENTPQAEDCLYLNVWAPADATDLPVMVWLHGGGFARGYAHHPMYNGQELAKRGVVFVSVAYRLNLMGMLAHPALTAEGGGASGNYALSDQIQALEWVQQNVRAFGGDPGNVTVFGESAGGRSISALMAAPKAAGLFHRGICQSGALANVSDVLKVREALAIELLGETDDVTVLRARAAADYLRFIDRFNANPMVDGQVIPEDPRAVYDSGRQHAVPLMIGVNADEGSLFSTGLSTAVRVPPQFKNDPAGAAAHIGRVRFFEPAWEQASWHQAAGLQTHFYHFTRVPPYRTGEKLGSFHGSEIPYVFGGGMRCGLFEPNSPRTTDHDRRLSAEMMDAWTGFAKSGDPGWTPFDPTRGNYKEFGDTIGERSGFDEKLAA